MKTQLSRRGALSRLGGAIAGLLTLSAARTVKAAVQKVFVASGAPKDYDPTKHKWLMCIDVNRCIGCGICVTACAAGANRLRKKTEELPLPKDKEEYYMTLLSNRIGKRKMFVLKTKMLLGLKV